jgi:glycosyltransferase involved in cell wall biosynthesis
VLSDGRVPGNGGQPRVEVGVLCYTVAAKAGPTREFLKGVPGSDRLKIHWMGEVGFTEHYGCRDVRRTAPKVVQEYDIVHLHGVWDPMIKVVADAATAAGKPLVLTPHGMLNEWSMRQGVAKKWLAMRLGWRGMLARVAVVHALNEQEAAYARAFCPSAITAVIPNGIYPGQFENGDGGAAFRSAVPEVGDWPYVLFLSRLAEQKGPDLLVEAFGELLACGEHREVGAKLVMAGPDYGMQEELKALVRRRGLEGWVIFCGPLFGGVKNSALSGCDMFVLPSRHEGFSMALLEAMASGRAVVFTKACHFAAAATAGAGIECDGNAGALARAMADVPKSAARGEPMGVVGRRLVEREYTWDVIAGRMAGVYEALLFQEPIGSQSGPFNA